MEDYWATRTGRWRKAMHGQQGPSFADRLFDVIVADIRAGALPAGALLPNAERVAGELMIAKDEVRSAYARLLAEDPDRGFAVTPGRLMLLSFPVGTGVRIDANRRVGDAVESADPLVAVFTAWGVDRMVALERLRRALEGRARDRRRNSIGPDRVHRRQQKSIARRSHRCGDRSRVRRHRSIGLRFDRPNGSRLGRGVGPRINRRHSLLAHRSGPTDCNGWP